MIHKKIIKEVIDNFINEELSVSEYLIKGVSYASKRIYSKFKENYGNEGEIDGHLLTRFIDFISFGEYGKIDCNVSVIDFKDKEEMLASFEKYDFGGETDQINYRINIKLLSLNGELDKQFLYNTLYHEAEHTLQFLKKNGGLYNSLSSYNKAVKILNGNDEVHSSEEYVMIANLLYFYNKLEIEANVNGLYGELINNGCKLNETNFSVNLNGARNVFKKFIEKYDDSVFSETMKYFGITYGKLLSFIKRQEDYLKYRVRKVYQKAWNDSNKQVEEHKKISPFGIYI